MMMLKEEEDDELLSVWLQGKVVGDGGGCFETRAVRHVYWERRRGGAGA